MAETCVKDGRRKEHRKTRSTAADYTKTAKKFHQTVTPDGYTKTITNKREIERKLEEQREEIEISKKVTMGNEWAPNIPALRHLENIAGSDKNSSWYRTHLAGKVGEQTAHNVLTSKMDFEETEYEPKHHGVDDFLKLDGKYVMVETKATVDAHGKDSLDPTTRGKQASVKWLNHKLDEMSREGSGQYSEANARIAEEIRQQGGAESVQRVLLHLNPYTMNVFAYEGKDAEGREWEPIALWEFDERSVDAVEDPVITTTIPDPKDAIDAVTKGVEDLVNYGDLLDEFD